MLKDELEAEAVVWKESSSFDSPAKGGAAEAADSAPARLRVCAFSARRVLDPDDEA